MVLYLLFESLMPGDEEVLVEKADGSLASNVLVADTLIAALNGDGVKETAAAAASEAMLARAGRNTEANRCVGAARASKCLVDI